MKYFFFAYFLLISISFYSQNDTIIHYLDSKAQLISKSNDEDIRLIQIGNKINDSLWKVTNYRNNGKVESTWTSRNTNFEKRIGKYMKFHSNDTIAIISNYDEHSMLNGISVGWFPNKNINYKGIYKEGKKKGVWKFYHYNGVLGAKGYFKHGKLLKSYYYDENGNQLEHPLNDDDNKNNNSSEDSSICKDAYFKGGYKNFIKKLNVITENIQFSIKGKLVVYFTVFIDGSITNVWFDEKIPQVLKNEISTYFTNIKGWHPVTHLGRKIPREFSIVLNFK